MARSAVITAPTDYSAQVLAILVVTVGAIEMAIGLALVLLLYRRALGDDGVDADGEQERGDDEIGGQRHGHPTWSARRSWS
jgi:hypothetical protein